MSKKTDTHELTINGKKCTAFAVADLHPDDLEKYQRELYFWWGDMLKLREIVPDVVENWYRSEAFAPSDKEGIAAIESDRIEVVTEYVEATALDALQALVANGGKLVEGWCFNDHLGDPLVELPIRGVDTEDKLIPFMAELNGCPNWYRYAYRPVTRVRIKAEVKPEPKFKEPPIVKTVEQAFSAYWQGGSEHRAIDAFRAGAAWAKEVQGE